MAQAHQADSAAPVELPARTSATAVVEAPGAHVTPATRLASEATSAPVPSAPRWSFSGATPAPVRPVTRTLHTVHHLPAPSLGPVGRGRHPARVVALSMLTLGAYSVAWHRRVNREMAEFDARLEVRAGASALGVALAWGLGLLCSLAGATIWVAHGLHHGPQIPLRFGAFLACGVIAVPYLVLLLPPATVAAVMSMERLRLVQERVGMRGERQVRPVARLAVLAIPLIGGLWHLAAFQSRLNAVWKESRLAALPEPPQHFVEEC